MKNCLVIALLGTVVLLTSKMESQSSSPTTEHNQLGYFVGKWTREFQVKPGSFSPGGKFVQTETNAWMAGHTFVLSHWSIHGEGTTGGGLTILGYSATAKVYTYDSYSASGQAEHGTGTLNGDTWTWLSDHTIGNKIVKVRFVIKILSPAAYSFSFDTQGPEGTWSTTIEGAAKRIEQ